MTDANREELAEILFPSIKLTVGEIEKKYPNRVLNEGEMVTRFGPSPTGFMHVGNLYGAFLDSVMAHQSNGVFYLRIEDTDSKREVDGAKNLILDSLNNFRIYYDEGYNKGGIYGPYVQSQRADIYQTYAKSLVKEGKAYPCFMSENELSEIREGQELRKELTGIYGHYAVDRDLSLDEIKKHLENNDEYVIRIKSFGDMNKQIVLHDLIKGDINLPENIIDEVILKKDGIPTYHFAHVIDDHLMHTTHVIRGDEWISSYPKHLQLSQLLGFKMPKYAHHAPLTKKEDGKIRKLSKRKDPEFSVGYYKEAGIPADAVKLYLATLANTNFEEWYIQNKDKQIEDFKFSYKKMPTGGTLFDMEKLNNICRTYFSRLSSKEIFNDSLNYYKDYDINFYNLMLDNKDDLLAFLDIERDGKRPRKDIATYKDIKEESRYIFDELFFDNIDDTYREINKDLIDFEILNDYLAIYDENDSEDIWYEKIQSLADNHGYAKTTKMYKENPDMYKGHIGDVCENIRHVVTGRLRTPNLYQILRILGKGRIQKRVDFLKSLIN